MQAGRGVVRAREKNWVQQRCKPAPVQPRLDTCHVEEKHQIESALLARAQRTRTPNAQRTPPATAAASCRHRRASWSGAA